MAHTSFCDIGWRVNPSGRAIVVSAIDNLLKGASGQAVQNMNLLLGIPEADGTRCERHKTQAGAAGRSSSAGNSRGSQPAREPREDDRPHRGRCPVVIVHGGGKEIDVALAAAGIAKQQVEGLRVTDERTLDVVVAVLAGSVNTRFVAALGAAGVPAVGLTGADARCGLSQPAPPHRTVDGTLVDLGRVGVPSATRTCGC